MATFLTNREEFPEDAVLAKAIVEDLLTRANLTERERAVLYLRYWLGLTQKEIAERLGISQPVVARTEATAIAKLRRLIK